jgi:hypothetical protein
MRFMIALSLIPLIVIGCATDSRVSEPEPVRPITYDFCAVYVPVYTAVADTEETKKQVDKNNAVWLEHCENR